MLTISRAHNTWTMINKCMNKRNNENINKHKYQERIMGQRGNRRVSAGYVNFTKVIFRGCS